MSKLCVVLGDQLTPSLSSLANIDKSKDLVLMCEVIAEASYVPHHPQKIAFIFAAMRHFAADLQAHGYKVLYTKLDAKNNTGSLQAEIENVLQSKKIAEILVTEPGEWRVLQLLQDLRAKVATKITILPDNRFLCSNNEFADWAKGKKQLRMEYFYRVMRRKYNILLEPDSKPVGGKWNYDGENRKNANKLSSFPQRANINQDSITKEVLALVAEKFKNNFGSLDGFNYAVTRQQALRELKYFISNCLLDFGTYQDAMRAGEINLFHSRLSTYLNVGLLLALEVCKKTEDAYYAQNIPLNCAEGFIRQVLGWREYVRGIYWLNMPTYKQHNFLNAKNSLPSFYWGEETEMFCIQEVVRQTKISAYSHHIQRLMVTGNFALLAGIEPAQVCDWYLAVYADAFEWVELPNTLGMALFADGGIMASKPYAASGKYINRMSDFCKSCKYNPNEVTSDNACPFNALYWNFIDQHQAKFKSNNRMHFALQNWQKMTSAKKNSILCKSQEILKSLYPPQS